MSSILAVILARGGSKGLPRKNLRPLAGKPLVAHALEAALAARRVDRVVLSSEDAEIGAVARAYGVEWIRRPPELSTDTAPVDPALRHAVRVVEARGARVGVVVALHGNVLRRPEAIDRVVDKLLATGADSVQTYVPYTVPLELAYRLDGDRALPFRGREFPRAFRRQDCTPAYHPDGAVLAVPRDLLMATEHLPPEGSPWLGRDRRAVVQGELDSVDIDEPLDLLWAEFLLERGLWPPRGEATDAAGAEA